MEERDVRTYLAVRVKGLRESRGWLRKELAERLGVSPAWVTLFERGEISPTLERLCGLVGVFNVKFGELFGEKR